MNETSKAIKEARELYKNGEVITHIKACQLISCKPARELLQKIIEKINNLLEGDYKIDFSKCVEILKLIERILFNHTLYRSPQVKTGATLYLSSRLTQEVISEITDCTMVSFRKLYYFLKNQIEYRMELVKYMPNFVERIGLTHPACKRILEIKIGK